MPTTARRIGTCTQPATTVLEARSPADGLAYGALQSTIYVCDGHAHAARTEWIAPPLTPFTAIADSAAGHRCGEATDLN